MDSPDAADAAIESHHGGGWVGLSNGSLISEARYVLSLPRITLRKNSKHYLFHSARREA